MRQIESANGQDLREMFAVATAWLEKSAADIDALNVFPVPDGDTGTNMLLTMRSAIEEAYRAPDQSASAVSKAMAKGALMGARGNSGVILSQIWRGLAQGLAEKESFTGADLADALAQASIMAYKGLSNPVEGTILTVINEAAAAAQAYTASNGGDLKEVLEVTVNAASESVARTPTLLPVLMEAGVVDAGGQGLYTILEGALRYLRGEKEQMQFRKPQIIVSDVAVAAGLPHMKEVEEVPYGYCTNILLRGQGLNPDKLRMKLKRKGESLVVAGDESTVRIHIHTYDPGKTLHYIGSLGTMHEINIRNMDEQHQGFLEMQRERTLAVDIAIIAVVAGDGLTEVFKSLGAIVVSGGQTMNPSTKDLLRAVDSVASDKVVILPNNKNIVLTASQVQSLTTKAIKVVPTETVPQGVAALLAFDYEADLETNTGLMEQAKLAVKSIEVTRASKDSQLNGLKIKKKQAIGLLDGSIVAAGDSVTDVLNEMLAELDLAEAEVITIYYGADTEQTEAEAVSLAVRQQYPELQIEVVKGGQPHYNFIVSIE